MLADDVLIVGSCNFTEASQRNVERGVRITNLPKDEVEAEAEVYEALWKLAVPYAEGFGEPMPRTPHR